MNRQIPETWENIPNSFSPQLKAILDNLLGLSENKVSHIAEIAINNVQNGTMPIYEDYKVLFGPLLIAVFLALLLLFSFFALPCISIIRKGKPINGFKAVFCFGVESTILTVSCLMLIVCVIIYWYMALEANKITKFYPKIMYSMADDLQLAVRHVDDDFEELNNFANSAIDSMTLHVQQLPEKQIANIETYLGHEYAMYARKSRKALQLLVSPSPFINDTDRLDPEDYNEMHRFVRTSCAFFDVNRTQFRERQSQSHDVDLQRPERETKSLISGDVTDESTHNQSFDEPTMSQLKEDLYQSLQQTIYPNILPNTLKQFKEGYEETYELEFGKESLQNAKVDFAETWQLQQQFRRFDEMMSEAKDVLLTVQTYTEAGVIQWDITDGSRAQTDIWTLLLLLPAIICIALITLLMISCLFGICEISTAIKTKRGSKCSTVKLLQIGLCVISFLVWIIFLWALIFYMLFSVVAVACDIIQHDYIFVKYFDNPDLWNGDTWLSHNLKQTPLQEYFKDTDMSDGLKIADVLDQCQRNETLFAILNLDEMIVNKYFNFTLDINIDELRKQTKLELKRIAFNNGKMFAVTKERLGYYVNMVELSLENDITNMTSNNVTIVRNTCKILKKHPNLTYLKNVMGDNYETLVLYWSLKQIQETVDLLEVISIILKEKLQTLQDTSMNRFFQAFNRSLYEDITALKVNLSELLRSKTGKCDVLSNVYNFSRDLLCEHVLYTFMGSFLFCSAMGILFLPILFLSFRMKAYLSGTLISDHHKLGKEKQRYQDLSRQIVTETNPF